MAWRGPALALGLAAIAAGCATTRPERPLPPLPEPAAEHARVKSGRPLVAHAPTAPPATPGNPPFYDVMGERYHVLPDAAGYREQGVASWYGREFHGRRTSSGEVYDMYALTAAHKTLPLPTTARVTNLENGKSIVVRVNDRGPFKKERIIDLSYAAARELGVIARGTALVEVQALEDPAAARATASSPPPGVIYVQVGAFRQQANAENLRRTLAREGFSNTVIRYDASVEPALYRVRIGPVANAADYDAVARRVTALNVGEPRLVVEPALAGQAQSDPAGAGLPGS